MVYFGFDDMSHKAEGKKERKKERREIICTSKRMYIICTYHVSCTFGQVFTLNTTCITYFKNTGSL